MSNSTVISILLPVLNCEKYLYSAIKSILGQTFQQWELLVLDDSSDDMSCQIAASFRDTRIVLVPPEGPAGLASRLNQGMMIARGRYIARMDADDIAFPERFARQVAYLTTHPEVDVVGTRAIVFRDDGSVFGLLPYASTHEAMCARPWNNIPLAHPTWMGKAEWFRKYRYNYPEYHRAEDQELLLRSHKESKFSCIPEVLMAYRQGDYSFLRIIIGRTALLRAQCAYFWPQKDWVSIIKSVITFSAKAAVDLAACLPCAQKLYFIRMEEQPDRESLYILSNLLSHNTI